MSGGQGKFTFAQEDVLAEIMIDSFAGGGGASTGMELATGQMVAAAINHDRDAILMHKTNHPYTEHFQASVWDVEPNDVCRGRPVGLAWFSPDCKHFSKAKGSALVDRKIRGLAWIVLRWAATVRPRVIILENVEEFQTWGPVRKGKPVKQKAGQTFAKWKNQLSALGYTIEHRELVAADYGAPTTRKRFVLVARCDGQPIVWPEPTHSKDGSDGKKKWRAACEIIDWSLPCYSVFASKADIKQKYGVNAVRPLADNTMRRVIRGVDKFTIRSGKPFIVQCNHSGDGHISGVEEPVSTLTAKFTGGVCEPLLSPLTISNTGSSTGGDASRPIHTIRTAGGQLLVAPNLIQYHTEQTENCRANGVAEPIMTVDSSNRYGLASAQLVEYYGNEQGALDVTGPVHTLTSHDREGLTLAHIAEFKGADIGQGADAPLRTITAYGGEFAAVHTTVVRYEAGKDLGHWPEIRGLLNRHCGYSLKQDEILLLMLDGTAFFLCDIGLRMLTPRELYNAMGFPPDYIIDRDYMGHEYGRTKQVARCGNAVCPPMAEAVVRANYVAATVKIGTMEQLMDMVAV